MIDSDYAKIRLDIKNSLVISPYTEQELLNPKED
jgi:hypothetical protein